MMSASASDASPSSVTSLSDPLNNGNFTQCFYSNIRTTTTTFYGHYTGQPALLLLFFYHLFPSRNAYKINKHINVVCRQ